jgi:hypothetical protein
MTIAVEVGTFVPTAWTVVEMTVGESADGVPGMGMACNPEQPTPRVVISRVDRAR